MPIVIENSEDIWCIHFKDMGSTGSIPQGSYLFQ